MPRSLTFKSLSHNRITDQFRELGVKFLRHLLRHVLPLVLMLILVCWVTLQADEMIQRSKQQPPALSDTSNR